MTFEEFAADRLPAVLKFAVVLTGDRSLAEDVVQEVLIRVNARWQMIGCLDRRDAYIRKMIVNEYLAWRRRSWRLVLSGAGSGVEGLPAPDPAAGYAEREAIVAELAKLPRRQRAVMVLRYYEGLCDQEIADVLGCRPGSVRGYASRALAALRIQLAGPSLPVPAVVEDIYQDWSWPAQPVPGGKTLWRGTFTQRMSPARPLLLSEDDGFAYTSPPSSANDAYGTLTVVCYAGTGQTGCGYGNTETPAGTWSLHRGRFVNPNPGLDDLSPAAVARDIIKGLWVVRGPARLNGRRAIKLTQTPAGPYQPLPVTLWVDAHTHLPLRMVNGAGTLLTQVDWSYLRPTAANLALLRVPIPHGYPRVTPPGSG